ncbi:YfiR family protein [Ideonella sp. DXS22W]|uniref:YfiR family protein n=1 Tax=Pseudaquabacterium inlustre TaxID=2984192 RepID=A0ABU9CHR0_9BURK
MNTRIRICQLLVLVATLLAGPAARGQADERTVKAAFLYNFIQFTQWPVPPSEPFRLCVLGRSALDEALARLEGKNVLNGLHISIRHVGPRDSLERCHALYVDDSQRAAAEELLPRLAGAPILTITDSDGLADRGMIIEIRKRDLKLAFDVNLHAARKANIDLSARLLKMAHYVAGAR